MGIVRASHDSCNNAEKRRQEPGDGKCHHESQGCAGSNESESLAQHHTHEWRRLGSERQAHSHLSSPLRYREDEQAIETSGHEEERATSKCCQKRGAEPSRRYGRTSQLIHGGDSGDGELGVQAGQLSAQRNRKLRGVALG